MTSKCCRRVCILTFASSSCACSSAFSADSVSLAWNGTVRDCKNKHTHIYIPTTHARARTHTHAHTHTRSNTHTSSALLVSPSRKPYSHPRTYQQDCVMLSCCYSSAKLQQYRTLLEVVFEYSPQ